MKLTRGRIRKLLATAAKVQAQAHAPYSKFPVGAALLGARGKIYKGVNVENASYGLTLCAERVALGQAISAGERQFVAIACVAPAAELSPCGACRQVLAEFGDLQVFCADSRDLAHYRCWKLSELLPVAFRLQ